MDQKLYSQSHDAFYMRCAIELAAAAAALGEVPVGAVFVESPTPGREESEPSTPAELIGRIRGEGFNRREIDRDPLAHAENLALSEAAKTLNRWRLGGTLYVTLEPCLMCAGSIINARVDRVVFGALDPKAGAVESLYQTLADSRLNHRPLIQGGVLAEECGELLTNFFKQIRARGETS